MEEHIIVKVSQLLKQKHEIENKIEELKLNQIKKSVEDAGLDYDAFLEAKEAIKNGNKDENFVAELNRLKNEDDRFAQDFYADIANAIDYMTPNEKGGYVAKLSDCTVTYTPKPRYQVVPMDEETKEEAIHLILENNDFAALNINEEKYIELNKKLREQGETKNCPGIEDRVIYLKEEFTIRKKGKRKVN